eukprot:gene9807-11456_t
MCRGLTSAGARMPDDIPEASIVAIMAEGKKHAAAIGLTKMSTNDIRTINADIGVINIHYLGDNRSMQVVKSLPRQGNAPYEPYASRCDISQIGVITPWGHW